MWDALQPWRPMFAAAASQPCAMQHTMCTNPVQAVLATNLVEFNFPIGDDAIDAAKLATGAGYSLYIYFDLSVVDTSERVVTTRLFAQAALSDISIARQCEGLQVKSTPLTR
jgi:hypothetical protein